MHSSPKATFPVLRSQFDNDRFNDFLLKRAECSREASANSVWATKASVAHQPQLSTKGDPDGFRCIERWWFESA
jgi:hypothetical protein